MTENEKVTINCHSLVHLLKNYEVRIPIIQRDYAQGRYNEKANAVRKRLIEDFINCLEDDDKSMDFNFIYGNTEGDIFYPVDGQQRLTSLYLLHWVLACRSEKIKEFITLKAFTYSTRNSANEFFRLLKNPNEELINLVKGINFKKSIKNFPWFATEWNNDPTVLSALIFIDDLCISLDKKKDHGMFYDRLVSENSAVIFTMLEENSGGNSETAAAIKYIRMNARGKELTTFENVKAMIDSIAEKFNIEPNISECYDRKHIDVFYEMASISFAEILKKNSCLDEMSLAFFKNVYNIVNLVKYSDDTLASNITYMNQMYEMSQKNSIDKEFLDFYFRILNRVLTACKNSEVRIKLKKVFMQDFTPINNRGEVALVLYLYYLIPDVANDIFINGLSKKIEKLQYILHNLCHANWDEKHYEVTNELLKKLAEYDDAFCYFARNVFNLTRGGLLDDIKVRIKEQHIKAKIIEENQLDYMFFDTLEKQSNCQKIQYLLLISDLWTDNDVDITLEKVENLFKYMKIANTYLKKNNCEWRKRLAVAGCSNSNGLLDCEEINKIDWSKNCEWNDNYYFWDDIKGPNQHKLTILRNAYNNETDQFSALESKLKEKVYENCWLRYAVDRNYMDLLDNPITYDQNTNRVCITINKIYSSQIRDFMAQVLLYDLGNMETGKRVDVLNCANLSCYGEITFITQVNKTFTFMAYQRYQHSYDKSLTFNDERNYNLTLRGTSTIHIGLQSKGVIVSAYNKLDNQLHLFVASTPCSFLKYYYDLSSAVDGIKNAINCYHKEFESIRNDNILEIYHGRTRWKHDGGNTHSWSQSNSYSLGQPYKCEEYTLA